MMPLHITEEGEQIESLRQQLAERDKQIAMLREVLEFYMTHGITEPLYYKAKEALSATADSDAWLRKHDAELVRKIADERATGAYDALMFIADQIESGEWK